MEKIKIAVLIDADNANPKCIQHTLDRISEEGEIVIKRVYGDWTQQQLFVWKDEVNKHSMRAIQAFSYVKGKNSTDIALIIDAMDILYSEKVNAFCIVSSDCDFTGLVHRLKEEGVRVFGLGKENACKAYKESCDKYFEEFRFKKKEIRFDNNSSGNNSPEIFRKEVKPLAGLKIIGKMDLNKFNKKTGTN